MLKKLAIITAGVLVVFVGYMYYQFRIHLVELPPAQAMQGLQYYIGAALYPSVSRAECSVLGGFHLDNFAWYRFPCAPDDLQNIVAHITGGTDSSSYYSGVATFHPGAIYDGEQNYHLLLDNERYVFSYFSWYDPDWWNKETLGGMMFYQFRINRGQGHIDLFYDAATQTAYMHVVEGS